MSPSSPNIQENLSHAGTEVVPAWKQELNERLAATRLRRLRVSGEHVALSGLAEVESKVESRASRLAAKVAQRYANAPSYSEMLAAEARARAERATRAVPAGDGRHCSLQPSPESAKVSLETEVMSTQAAPDTAVDANQGGPALAPPEEAEEAAIEPLAVNLVTFPRELVAPRKARPRLAEGPLRETAQQTGHDQLKIFDVAPESISQTARIGAGGAEWSPIRLDTDSVPRLPAAAARFRRRLHSRRRRWKTA